MAIQPDKLSPITLGAAIGYMNEHQGSSTMIVKTVQAGDTFPTTRPDGTTLILGDWVKPKPTATFPFTISGITFNSVNDQAVWGGSSWLYNANPFQKTSETPLTSKSEESLSGDSNYQSEVNKENVEKFDEIDEALDKKLDKIEGTGTLPKAYVHNADATEGSIEVSQANDKANAIVQRGANSQIKVPLTPVADEDASSKKYTDEEVAKKSKVEVSDSGTSTTDVSFIKVDNAEKRLKDSTALHPTDVKNNLTSTDTDKPLSAKQGKELDEKKVEKSTDTTKNIAYVRNAGVEGTEEISSNADANTLVERGTGGVVKVGNPTDNADAVNKQTLDTELAKKVGKSTDASKVYGTDNAGAQKTLDYSQASTPNVLVQRNSTGEIVAPNNPSTDNTVANKKYVDDSVDPKLDKVETTTDKAQYYTKNADGSQGMTDVPEVDTAMSDSSTNAVQNKIIKEYVDGKVIQYSTMPTASASLVGKIVQFTGTTDSNYTNGFFYICEEITPETSPKTYHWVNKLVQTGGGGGADVDNKSIILNNQGKAETSVYAYDNRKTETILIGECTGVNYLAENIKEFTSTTPAQISTFAVGDRIVGTYSILRIGQFGFDKIAQAVTITKYGSTETINMIGVEAIDGVYFGVYNDGTNDHLIVADTANSISSLTCIMENTNRVSGELKTIKRKFFNQTMAFRGYIGETEPEGDIWPEEGDFWCKTQVMPSETPLNVYRYTNNGWTEETEEYYPGVFEIWSDINLYPYKDYYWNGYEWIIISSDTTQVDNISIEKNDGILAIKQAGVNTARLQNGCVTKEKISSDAYVIFREDVINNLTSTSVYKPLAAYQGKVLNEIIGSLSSLATSVKTSIVNAINELVSTKVNVSDIKNDLTSTDTNKPLSANQGKVLNEIIGSLSSLTTTVKTSIVNAINELVSIKVNIADIVDNLTSTDTNKPLSAKQGKVLNEKTTKIWKQSSEPADAEVGDLWVDEQDETGNFLEKSGGTMTGAITMGTNAIKFGANNKELKANGDSIAYNDLNIPRIVTTTINGTTDINGNYRLTTPTGYTNYIFVGCKGSCQWSGTSWTAEVTYVCMMDGYYINVTIPNGTTLEPQKSKAVRGDAYWLVW